MATDATGTPTALGIPKYNTNVDAPSGLGFNAAMDAIDTLLRQPVKKNGTLVGTRRNLNLIEGSGISITVADDSGADEIDVTVATTGGGVPAGTVLPYAGSAAPAGYLMADGSAVSRSTYADLFTAIGTTYGAGDGSTTFNLPDLQGRVTVGKGTNAANDTLGENEGVSEANRRGTKHRHTPHVHSTSASGALVYGSGGNGGGSYMSMNDTGLRTSANPVGSADGGSGVATDPLDGGAFIVLNQIIKT